MNEKYKSVCLTTNYSSSDKCAVNSDKVLISFGFGQDTIVYS